ncbi:MAG TPA: NAD-dependent epimerase/dehydratase family protein [Aggregatilineales bacterium]|nr:NAD-dependent epimerase/dehydratase family protein [Aggregatilineales bacterium]HPV08026.1 NAD-dependent epimerase/dehydratase family protein [Aggregatilineales bacterium]
MRFLVTGGAGFIGSALANRLVALGHEVRVIDNLTSGDPDRLDPRVLFTRGDVADIPKLWTLLQDVSCVYHLAARVSVPESIKYPRDYNHVNVGGTVSVMEAMRDAGVQRVVLASSGAVYGSQSEQPLHEDLIPNPDSPYAVSKLAAETYVRTIGALWGIETVALRIFNAYGPGQQLPASHAPVIPRFIRAAQTGASLVVFNNGEQTRDFVYIEDVVDALVAAATAPDVDRQVINVGSGRETSINELVAAIGEVLGMELEPLYNRDREGGVQRMCADITRAERLLGFVPRTDLHEGLRCTVEQDARFKSPA